MLSDALFCAAVSATFGVDPNTVARALEGEMSSTSLKVGPAAHVARRLHATGHTGLLSGVCGGDRRAAVRAAATGGEAPTHALRGGSAGGGDEDPSVEAALSHLRWLRIMEAAGSVPLTGAMRGSAACSAVRAAAWRVVRALPGCGVRSRRAAAKLVDRFEAALIDFERDTFDPWPNSDVECELSAALRDAGPAVTVEFVRSLLMDRERFPKFDPASPAEAAEAASTLAWMCVSSTSDVLAAELSAGRRFAGMGAHARSALTLALFWTTWRRGGPKMTGVPFDPAVVVDALELLAPVAPTAPLPLWGTAPLAQEVASAQSDLVTWLTANAPREVAAGGAVPRLFGVGSLAEVPDGVAAVLFASSSAFGVASVASEVTDGGRRARPQTSALARVLEEGGVSAAVAFALADTHADHVAVALEAVRGTWPAGEFDAAAALHPGVAPRVLAAAPFAVAAVRAAGEGAVLPAGFGGPPPRWLVEASMRSGALADWVVRDGGVRAELASAAAGLSLSQCVAAFAVLDGFGGTPAELAELAAELGD